MTAALLVTTSVIRPIPQGSALTVSDRLRDVHRRWMNETWQWLAPALSPDADFWNGWSAVRYINDQFDRQYRRQRALVAAILPLLPPVDAGQLRATTEMLERTRRHLDRVGRRQGMTEMVAGLSGRFLDLLGTWFAEIRRVTQELTRDELPLQGPAGSGTARDRCRDSARAPEPVPLDRSKGDIMPSFRALLFSHGPWIRIACVRPSSGEAVTVL